MLSRIFHKLAAQPWVYDRIQDLAGQKEVLRRLAERVGAAQPRVVIDIGGGTGTARKILPKDCHYVCLDVEMSKLAGFRSAVKDGFAILGDATRIPVRSSSADMVICKSVTHHLDIEMLARAFEESARVLRSNGQFVLLDAILNPKRLAGTILWRLDRGSYPRSENELLQAFESRFKVIHWEKFAIYHEYVLGIGVPI
jgi:ubiquinone/menaquinone biosynthesis C-methylase UbiE